MNRYQIYNLVSVPEKAWWKFDEATGLTAIDSSGNNNTGNLISGTKTPVWTTGIIGNALQFNNGDTTIGGVIEVADSTSLSLPVMTLCAWLRPTVNTGETFFCIANKRAYVGNFIAGFRIGMLSGGVIRFATYDGLSSVEYRLDTTGYTLPLNQYTFVLFEADATNKRIYTGTVGIDSSLVLRAQTTPSNYANGQPRELGIGGSGTTNEGFVGIIDQMRIFSALTTVADKISLYGEASGCVSPNPGFSVS